MKWLGTKVIQLSTIKLPAGFAKRKKEPHVKELAASIMSNGVIALPVVRNKPRELVAGGDRLAALMLLGTKRHEVRLVEGTDEELEAVTLEENLLRRRGDDYDAMTARLVELRTGAADVRMDALAAVDADMTSDIHELPANVAANSEPRPVGRPKTAKGIAREEVAKATGRTPEAVRQAEKRARTEETDVPGPSAPEPPPVDTFDLEVADAVRRDWFPRVRVVQEVLRDSLRKLEATQRRLTLDLKTGSNIAQAAYSRTYQAVHDAVYAVRMAMPESVCPWCKAQLHLTPACSGCGETGFVASSVLEGISPELLERGARAKVPDGKGGFRGLGGPGPSENRKPAKGARKVRIENEHGEELVPDPDQNNGAVAEEPIF